MTTPRLLSTLAAAALLLGMPGGAYAAGKDAGPIGEKREKILQKVETIRIARMTEALELSPETAEKLFPAIRPFNERRAAAMASRLEALRGLREQLDGPAADPKIVAALLDTFLAAQKEFAAIGEEEYAVLKKVLDPVTLARYYRFQAEFEREVGRVIKEFRKDGPMPMRQQKRERMREMLRDE